MYQVPVETQPANSVLCCLCLPEKLSHNGHVFAIFGYRSLQS